MEYLIDVKHCAGYEDRNKKMNLAWAGSAPFRELLDEWGDFLYRKDF